LKRGLAFTALMAALAGSLGGCGGSRSDAAAPPCPKVAVLADASHLTVYREGPGRDLTDVVFEADLGRITGQCIYARRKDDVVVDMKVQITARRGPADRNRAADFVYFVAVVDAQSNVLARQEFRSQIVFRPDQTTVVTLEELEPRIPLKRDQPGSDFDVLVGFKLTPEQVERNRAGTQ
jgi:hypothetical protein